MPFNMKGLCRLCMTHKGIMLPIFVEDNTGRRSSLSDRIIAFTGIKLSPDDGMPAQVCQKCVYQVNTSFDFMQICENTDVKLRTFMSEIKLKEESFSVNVQIKKEPFRDDYYARMGGIKNSYVPMCLPNESNLEVILDTGRDEPIKPCEPYQAGPSEHTSLKMGKLDPGTKPCEDKHLTIQHDGKKLWRNFPVAKDDKLLMSEFPPVNHGPQTPFQNAILEPHKAPDLTHRMEAAFGPLSCLNPYTENGYMEHAKPFKCSTCDKTFTQKASLNCHLKLHRGQKDYTCHFCARSFSQNSCLKSHLRLHTGHKPYSCPFCSKAFAQSSNLKCHIRTHTGEKPFCCSFCKKTFVQKTSLNNHVKTTHANLCFEGAQRHPVPPIGFNM